MIATGRQLAVHQFLAASLVCLDPAHTRHHIAVESAAGCRFDSFGDPAGAVSAFLGTPSEDRPYIVATGFDDEDNGAYCPVATRILQRRAEAIGDMQRTADRTAV